MTRAITCESRGSEVSVNLADMMMAALATNPQAAVFYAWLATLVPITLYRTYGKMRRLFKDLAQARKEVAAVELESLYHNLQEKVNLRFPIRRAFWQRTLACPKRWQW